MPLETELRKGLSHAGGQAMEENSREAVENPREGGDWQLFSRARRTLSKIASNPTWKFVVRIESDAPSRALTSGWKLIFTLPRLEIPFFFFFFFFSLQLGRWATVRPPTALETRLRCGPPVNKNDF